MTPAELHTSVKAGKLAPIYILQGEERLLLDEALEAVQSAVLAGGLADFNFDRFRGKETDAARLETALGTSPMMAPRRLVMVREFDVAPEPAREVLVAYAKSPAPSTVLVLVAEKPDARTTVYKALSKIAAVVKFEAPFERDLVIWCQRRIDAMGAKLDADAARLCVEAIGRDMAGLADALERLFLLVGKGGRISGELVLQSIVETREQSAFELCDAVGGGEAMRAWTLARKLLNQREPELRLLALLSRHFRQLLRLREARDKGIRRDDAAAAARVSPYALKNLWPQTEKHSTRGLELALAHIAQADIDLKSSRLPSDVTFERLVVALCKTTRERR